MATKINKVGHKTNIHKVSKKRRERNLQNQSRALNSGVDVIVNPQHVDIVTKAMLREGEKEEARKKRKQRNVVVNLAEPSTRKRIRRLQSTKPPNVKLIPRNGKGKEILHRTIHRITMQ